MAIRGHTRYVSVTEAPHKTHSLRMDGEETLGFYESWISVGSVCCSASPGVTCLHYMTNIKPTSVQRLVFAGFELMSYMVSAAHLSSQTRDVEPMLVWCWPIIVDAGPTSTQHWLDASCLMGEATRTKADTCHNPEAEDITNLPRCSTSKRRQSPLNSQPKYLANWLTASPN